MHRVQMLVVSLFVAGAVAAQQQNAAVEPAAAGAAKAVSREQMVKFVEEAAAYVKQVGKEAALKEFSDPQGKFVRAGRGIVYLRL